MIQKDFLVPAHEAGKQQCHASTLLALPAGDLLVAWFAGPGEGQPGTAIWLTRRRQGHWLPPQRVVAGGATAHWNPVLFSSQGELWLFFKTGESVHVWRTYYIRSSDEGSRWSAPKELVPGDPLPRGPSKNKLLITQDGTWVAPGSVETDGKWDAFVDCSHDNGKSWTLSPIPLVHQRSRPVQAAVPWPGLDRGVFWHKDVRKVLHWDGVIQPSLWESAPRHLHLLMRSTRGWLYRSDSTDNGSTWTEAYATSVPSNNSGIDLVKMDTGALALVYNPVKGNWGARSPLTLSLSADNGEHWTDQLDVETGEGEFSYPALICVDGTLCLTYTWKRENIAFRALRDT
ncbi:sialidase family protein [Pandoraea sputorum]|uniref:sialidase family protein n=1 Tax=Pandoraea sputorum TaxID=93222 RepID=UPI001CD60B29|nr:sialidase family protein [Pandoraea sputorum]